MRKLFEIDENEKRRILEMHEKATKNLYLSEQQDGSSIVSAEQGVKIGDKLIKLPGINDVQTLNKFVGSWGGPNVCDKTQYLVKKGLKFLDKGLSRTALEYPQCNEKGTFAQPVTAAVVKALENIAMYEPDFMKVKDGKVYGNIMKINNERYDEMIKTFGDSFILTVQKVAADQYKDIYANINNVVDKAKKGLSAM